MPFRPPSYPPSERPHPTVASSRNRIYARKMRDRRAFVKCRGLKGHACAYCGRALAPDEVTIDHVNPLRIQAASPRGTCPVVACCGTCNRWKGDRLITEIAWPGEAWLTQEALALRGPEGSPWGSWPRPEALRQRALEAPGGPPVLMLGRVALWEILRRAGAVQPVPWDFYR